MFYWAITKKNSASADTYTCMYGLIFETSFMTTGLLRINNPVLRLNFQAKCNQSYNQKGNNKILQNNNKIPKPWDDDACMFITTFCAYWS